LYSVGYRCPENYNVADYIMELLSDGNTSVHLICDEFAASKHAELIKSAISNEIYYVSIYCFVHELWIKNIYCLIIKN